ncbi:MULTISPECIES: hypothetical protein [unclassified Micromonospora]|uniref:hypothetical protein n=1 Tax=unclassified Micromonospora TaxID=2617518 RepID=UPI002FEE95A3
MPLNMPEPPGRMREETRAKLGRVAGVRGMGLPALGAAAPENVEVSTPHQVFTMGLDDVEAGGGLERARPGGWRFLLESGGEVIASAETAETPEGARPPTFNEGPYVGATATAVKAARALPQLATARFELRLLRIPALYLMALWLHSPTTDLLIPLAPSPIGSEGKVVPPPVFFRELAAHARTRGASEPSQGAGQPRPNR